MGLLKAKRNGQLVAYRLDKAAVIVGSGEACNIKVADAGLVARHCQILKMENGYVLRDMSGDAGTFVNGKKVKEHLLADRDVIQVGKERFTFSESEGENTARVAVSVAPAAATPAAKTGATTRATAPPPARSGNTGRIAAPPAKSGNTGRIAAPAPAPESAGRSTQRVNKGTQRTATAQKTTGRIEGGTRKITARTAAAMGYQTSKPTFAMPSTRKGKMIAIGTVVFILALGGVMYLVKSGQVNPDQVREEMNAELKAVQKLRPDQVIEIDNGLEELLNKHAPVQKYVAQRYSEIEREHKKVHQIALDLKKALKEVQPFITKFETVSKGKPDDLKSQAQALYDECKSLMDSHGGTTLGDKLRPIQDELKKILEQRGPSWTEQYPGLQRDTQKMMDKGDFAGALKAANAFGVTFKEDKDLELFKKLDGDMRPAINRRAEASPKKVIDAAKKLLEDKKKDDAVKLLEEAKAGLEGFPKPLEKIEAELQAIKK